MDKDIKQDWPQDSALRSPTSEQMPTGCVTIQHYCLGPAIQPVCNPAKSTPIQPVDSQVLQEKAVGDCIKGFAEIQEYYTYSASLFH